MTNRFLKVSGFLSLLWLPIMATSAEYKVHMAGWEFKPSPLTISVGDTVVWVNNDDTKHKLSFEDKSLGGPTRDNAHVFKIGDNFSFIFKKTGEYKYTCVTHEGQDMSGVVIVK
ncbi:MAG: plastocyanin/azurin family copper-binding protein [Gammaproteobacteria bacterium]|nr:plastocyanin/azurin family copper-binding protein [Gammaproteobacteria bacterium]